MLGSKFDVVVIGAGHAGVEAALAAARIGARVLLITQNLDVVAKASCNPSVGGPGKTQLVYEISALGGAIGRFTDKTSIHKRILNTRKGKAVWALRAQIDRFFYAKYAKEFVEKEQNLVVLQGVVDKIILEGEGKYRVKGVWVRHVGEFFAPCVVYCPGTFPNGKVFIGKDFEIKVGRMGEKATGKITDQLKELGMDIGRLKTGTPPRVKITSVNLKLCELQPSEAIDWPFDYWEELNESRIELPCYITRLSEEGAKFIKENLLESALFLGKFEGVGPRYCPSIEDKVHKFGVKEYLVFLEPEGVGIDEFYVQGMSTSLPMWAQEIYIRKIRGLENCVITRYGYAIEYDYLKPYQIEKTLEVKKIEGLFTAGQINGTSGYEEAAAQGILAGINAALKSLGEDLLVLGRDSYIGVLVDDLADKVIDEPYRMFTSRLERRMSVRWDNAWLRMAKISRKLGLLDRRAEKKLLDMENTYKEIVKFLRCSTIKCEVKGKRKSGFKKKSLWELLKRQDVTLENLLNFACNEGMLQCSLKNEWLKNRFVTAAVEIDCKYENFIKAEKRISFDERTLKRVDLSNVDYDKIPISFEARQKLKKYNPKTLLEAYKIGGIRTSDIENILKFVLRER